MDELMELMNNDGVDDSESIVDRESDDFFIGAEEPEIRSAASAGESRNGRDRGYLDIQNTTPKLPNDHSVVSTQSTFSQHGTHLAEASIDDRLGIRMTNRIVPSGDLSELVADYTYFSPSVLSAMPLKRLNCLLQDPSPIVDPATVAGKTESLITVGIVFSNSGTRISSKGGAFCILTIGNLNSGPCLSIFLFGEAYGKYCCYCKKGKVIALIVPKLLPSSRGDGSGNKKGFNSDHTVSFSVYDVNQLKVIANARDYSTCKSPACKNHADRSKSEYCDFCHRQKSKGGKQSLSKFQQIKVAHCAAILVPSTRPKKSLIGSNQGNKPNRFLDKTSVTNTHSTKTVSKSTQMKTAGKSTTRNNLSVTNVPMQMSKKTGSSSIPNRKPNKNHGTAAGNSSTYKFRKKREATTGGGTNISTKDSKRPKNSSSGFDFMKEGKEMAKKRGPSSMSRRSGFPLSHYTKNHQAPKKTTYVDATNAKKPQKPRLINTSGIDYDGSVSIPKPSKLFEQSSASKKVPTGRVITPTNESKTAARVLQQQSEVAQRTKEGSTRKYKEKRADYTLSNSRIKASDSRQPSNGRTGKKSKEVNSFLAAMGGEIDEEKIRNAKSQFNDEVKADEYAKQRRKVDELEKREASQELREKKKKSGNGKNRRITTTWFCKNCEVNYTVRPESCFGSTHKVTEKRVLKVDKTKEERRNELHRNGGLKIGSGLDWSLVNYK